MINPIPIPKDIGEYFRYEPETGLLIRTQPPSPNHTHLTNTVAGDSDKDGYLKVNFRSRSYRVHRIIWFLQTGDDLGSKTPDHINGVTSDNSWSNLRITCGSSEQARNTGALGYQVHPQGTLQASIIGPDGKREELGSYYCPLLARIAYHTRALEVAPNINVPFVPRKAIKGNPSVIRPPRQYKALGYCQYRNKLRASIKDGTSKFLGDFLCPLMARIAYHDAATALSNTFKVAFVPDAVILGNPTINQL